jgi:hypothetical protein
MNPQVVHGGARDDCIEIFIPLAEPFPLLIISELPTTPLLLDPN